MEEGTKLQFTLQAESEDQTVRALKAAGAQVNDVEDINEFRKAAVAFREKYVKEKGPKWEGHYGKVLAVD
jgi:TRAP-type C4-dicarboxylate transport system substrate-binding protein